METGEASSPDPNYKILGSCSNEDYAALDESQTSLLQSKPRNSRTIAIIYGCLCLDSTGYNGVGVNITVYISRVLKESNAATVAKVSLWNGTCFLLTLVGAFIADSYLGNYKTVLLSGLLYIPGMVMVTISAISSSSVLPVSEANVLLFYCALYLIAAGQGGIRAAMIPHAMEQFGENERRRKEKFFNRYYVCLAFGSLVSGTFTVWIEMNVSWALGFGLSATCVVLAGLLFVSGTPAYRLGKPSGSPLKSLLQVISPP